MGTKSRPEAAIGRCGAARGSARSPQNRQRELSTVLLGAETTGNVDTRPAMRRAQVSHQEIDLASVPTVTTPSAEKGTVVTADHTHHSSPSGFTGHVDRRTDLEFEAFVNQYVRPNLPVVISRAIDHWSALGRWTPQFFAEQYGDRDAGVDDLTLAELIERVVDNDPSIVKRPYLRNVSIDREFPELRADIAPTPPYLQPNWFHSPLVPKRIKRNRTDLFIGGRGSAFPYLHFDNYHGYAFIFQIYGRKQFVLASPADDDRVYRTRTANGVDNVSEIDDPLNPDLERFPLFADVAVGSIELGPGDMLFIPAGWWHTTRMHGPSISVSSNVANRHNWPALVDDFRRSREDRPAARMSGTAYLSLVRLVETAREHVPSGHNR